jgi:hypothetical protein
VSYEQALACYLSESTPVLANFQQMSPCRNIRALPGIVHPQRNIEADRRQLYDADAAKPCSQLRALAAIAAISDATFTIESRVQIFVANAKDVGVNSLTHHADAI